MTEFKDLELAAPLLKALADDNYSNPTPIQAQAIPPARSGRDVLGIAQTGTGKTAAFALPILNRLLQDHRPPRPKTTRVLVLSPTRELATQIADSFKSYGRHMKLRVATVFGGVGHRPQIERLARGVDVLVATPGRLIDHLDSRAVTLSATEVFVLDEADQMLDMGFIHAIRKITPQLPKERQTLFFSATMPREIDALAANLLSDPVKVSVAPVATTAERVAQSVIFVETARKRTLLAEVLRGQTPERALVFSRTKHGADRIVRQLGQDGIEAVAIHGNKSQAQRERALAAFKSGKAPILIATDIAARGIDIDGVSHVVNFDLPNIPEAYVHRIGRTARAGASGVAISFCDREERAYLRDIERLTRQSIPSTDRRENTDEPVAESAEKPKRKRGGRGRSQGAGGQPQTAKAQPGNGQAKRGGRRRGRPGSPSSDPSAGIGGVGFMRRSAARPSA